MSEKRLSIKNIVDAFKKAFTLFFSHYLMVASSLAFIFSTICFAWTTSYFNMWGIEFFDYASVSDMYVVAFKLGIVLGLVFTSLMIIMIIALVITLVYFSENFVRSFASIVALNIGCLITIGFLTYTLFIDADRKNPYEPSEFFKIKDVISESARVNVKLRWNTLGSIDCVAVIGGTADYLFVWDYKKSSPIILARSSVMMVSVAVPKMPDFVNEIMVAEDVDTSWYSRRGDELPPPPNGIRSPENKIEFDKWVSDLKSVCDQSI